MQVIDIKYWLNETAGWAGSAAVAIEGEKTAEIITWITSRDRGLPAGEALKCRRRPKRKPCKGILKIQFEIDDQIHWFCPNAP